MSFELPDLKPSPVFYKDYELIPFNLGIEVWCIDNFGSIGELVEKINSPDPERPYVLYEVLHKLLKDKSKFKDYTSIINKSLVISKQKLVDDTSLAYLAVKQSIDLSMPRIKNPERMKALSKMTEVQGAAPVCYGVYFDKVAKRYGYTVDQFYELTLRQLHIFLKVIEDESYKELEVQAALQGRELKPRMEVLDISPEEEQEQEDAAKEAHARLMERYKQENGR